jgi:hypothetical protein
VNLHLTRRALAALLLLPALTVITSASVTGGHSPNGFLHDHSTAALEWSAPLSVDPDRGFPDSVSCTSSTFCMAVDYYGAAFEYRGSTWSTPKSIDPPTKNNPAFESVSCPTSTFCAAVDDQDNVLTYRANTWTSQKSVEPRYDQLDSVSCISRTFLVAVDFFGHAIR